jgi:hypothetical protein
MGQLRTRLAYYCMRVAVRLDADWVAFASLALVKQRVEDHLHEQGFDYEEPEPEHITVTYH